MEFQEIAERMQSASVKSALLYNQMWREEKEEEKEGGSLEDKIETRTELWSEVDTGGAISQQVVKEGEVKTRLIMEGEPAWE